MQKNILDFYKDQDIFITGGLGFMGKVLIEKLLRSCSELQRIFILIRPKKDKSTKERLQDMLKSVLFDKLKSENPTIFSKLIPITGDVSIEGLGISLEEFEIIKNTSIFIHSAATTRFKGPLSNSLLINTYGTYQVMELAKKLKNIKSFVHISTIFCNLDQNILEEKIYPPYADWRVMIELAKNTNECLLEAYVKNHISADHNSYTLSKHLAEQVVESYKNHLPIVVFRPAVVVNMVSEPLPGWTDSLSGPLALAIGAGTGIIRMLYGNISAEIEMVAADVAIKAIIVAAYKKGIEGKSHDVTVYNCSNKLNLSYLSKIYAEIIKENPFEKCIWNPSLSSTNNRFYFLINFFLFQLLPAIFMDGILRIFGRKPFLYNLQKKVYNISIAYQPFHSDKFIFKCENMIKLDQIVQHDEYEKFAFLHFRDTDVREYLFSTIKAYKRYYMNDPEESTKRAKILSKFLFVLDKLIKIIFYAYLLNWVTDTNIVRSILD